MEWLNYHHLYYFWIISKEGGVAAAARKLRLTHSTLSAQLRALERHFGTPLFERRGKRLALTPFGADAANYAADIFRLGHELGDLARGCGSSGRDVLRVGIVASLPKTLAHRLVSPALAQERGTLVVRQGAAPLLFESLSAGRLHLVLSDEIPSHAPGIKLHAHDLGETDIVLYARGQLARRIRRGFPASLDGEPVVLPSATAPVRRLLDAWFVSMGVRPRVKAEVDDAGLMRVFGSAGHGVFPVRAALQAEVEDLHDVQLVGSCDGLRERYYAVSMEKRIRHRGVAAIVEAARSSLECKSPETD